MIPASHSALKSNLKGFAMPELPEVETFSRNLGQCIVGKSIVDAHFKQPRALNLPPQEFARLVKGRIGAVRRRGKSVILILENGSIWLHLGLTGQPIYAQTGQDLSEATAWFRLDDQSQLAIYKSFMGHTHFVAPEEFDSRWAELGIEPLDPTFTVERFREILKSKPGMDTKAILMDQSLIAGIGNIYSDEILYRAGIRPDRKAVSLTPLEIARLHEAIKSVLTEAIELGGEAQYQDALGNKGRYIMQIHRQEHCPHCCSPVVQATFHGRRGYYCSNCQV
ncbi:MAG: hypothetical protein M1136_05160 [Chloroflexi bacterium]|nr:hypothetical protein [Chloroflexota bacterium]MCL5075025.1 hypothetical protein [Chloroflexota bacterium]